MDRDDVGKYAGITDLAAAAKVILILGVTSRHPGDRYKLISAQTIEIKVPGNN